MIPISYRNKGFTLIELLIAMVVASVVMAGVYAAFDLQQKSHAQQQQVVDIQQNVRAALCLMERDIRLVGHNPTGAAGIGILTAGPHSFRFTLDIHDGIDNNGDGSTDEFGEVGFADGNADDSDEDITFGFLATADGDNDGIADAGAAPLIRTFPAPPLPVTFSNGRLAENIQAMGFAYAYDNDGDDQLDITPGGNVIWAVDSDGDGDLDVLLDTDDDGDVDTDDSDGGIDLNSAGFLLPTNIPFDRIRAVKIWLLARTASPVRGHLNNRTYVVGDKKVACNDSFPRRLMTVRVKCRNMGL